MIQDTAAKKLVEGVEENGQQRDLKSPDLNNTRAAISRSPSDTRSTSDNADHLSSPQLLPQEGKNTSENLQNTNSIDSMISNNSKLGRSLPKSRRGCITCKVRRKKCDEVRPVCKDCQRFGKECVWIDPNSMTIEDARKLKDEVQARESLSKLRNRSRTIIHRKSREGTAPPIDPPIIQVKIEKLDSLDQECRPLDLPQSSVDPIELPQSNKKAKLNPRRQEHEINQIPQENFTTQDFHNPQFHIAPKQLQSHNHRDNLECKSRNRVVEQGDISPSLTAFTHIPSFGAFSPSPSSVRDSPTPAAFSRIRDDTAAFEHGPKSGELSLSPNSSTFFNFLREASLFASTSLDKLTLLDLNQEESSSSKVHSPPPTTALQELKHAHGFNIFDFLEQVHPLSHDSPTQFLLLASSFNAVFSTAPQPALSEIPELDAKGLFLYNYYLETLSKKVSIAPTSQNESNSYQRVFLPLAQKDKGVLYAILAWAGFHLGGKYMKEGSKYAEMAVNSLLRDVDFTRNACIEDRRTIVYKLATILILCGAEICRGDVKIWSVYLDWGWRLLRDNGGILNFDTNKEEHWLISNFAYHDLLAVSERPSYFTHETYDKIFSDPNGNSTGNLNPLLGVSKALYKVIGEINQYAYEAKTPMRNYYGKRSFSAFKLSPTESVASDCSEQSNTSSQAEALSCLHASLNKAKELDTYIENCRPEMSDLVNLSDSDLELQLTTFEAFQVSCKLHLRQSILKLNPSALECQILVHHLTKCIDILIGTPMQATLVFPIFIAGLFMVTDDDKQAMNNRFELMMKLYGPWNVVRAKYVVEKVWELNPDGNKWCDWCSILSDLGWELNFA